MMLRRAITGRAHRTRSVASGRIAIGKVGSPAYSRTGGGSGSFAVQLAKRAGAHVTAVDNATKQAFMRSIGADVVVDYRVEDFTRTDQPYDLILDLVAHRSMFAYLRALAPGGRYRCVGGTARALLRAITVGFSAGLATARRMGVLVVKPDPEHFQRLADLIIAGGIAIRIDRTFDLDDTAAALGHVGEGRALGKVVVTVVIGAVQSIAGRTSEARLGWTTANRTAGYRIGSARDAWPTASPRPPETT